MPTIKKMPAHAASYCKPLDRQKDPPVTRKGHEETNELLKKFANSPNTINENLRFLYDYLSVTEHYIKNQWQPDSAISTKENHAYNDNIKCIIANENVRKKDLNLSISHSISTFKDLLTTKKDGSLLAPPFHQRCIVGLENAAGNAHYIYADIKATADKALSVIFIDSLRCDALGQPVAPHERDKSLYHSLALVLEKLSAFKNISVTIIPTGVQASPNDCLIFSTSFALKAYRYAEQFSEWHTQCLQKNMGNLKNDEPADETRIHLASFYTKKEKPVDCIKSRPTTTLGEKTNAYIYDYQQSYNLLPADFFKHTSSTGVITNILKKLKNEVVACTPDKTKSIQQSIKKICDIDKDGIENRYIRGDDGDHPLTSKNTGGIIPGYLTSIEYKRRVLILRTIKAEEAKHVDTKSKFSL